MKKYVLTDAEGFTADHQQLKPGKFIFSTKKSAKDPLNRIVQFGCDHPLLAVMRSPNLIDSGTKLLSFQVWNVDIDASDPKAYAIVKEVSMPEVTIEHKLTFAISLLKEIFRLKEFIVWADGWLSGQDRSKNSINILQIYLEQERAGIKALKQLASTHAVAGSQALTQEQDDLISRAMYVASAAEEAVYPQHDKDMTEKDITLALMEIEKYGHIMDMVKLAKEAFENSNVIPLLPVKSLQLA